MSKKAATEEPPKVVAASPARDVVTDAQTLQQFALADEALRRFAPFLFTFTSNTKENVELQVQYDALARDSLIQQNLFVVDRAETLNWFSQLSADHQASLVSASCPAAPLAQLVAEVKANLPQLVEWSLDLSSAQSTLVAAAVRARVLHFAMIREKARLAELAAIHQAHLELIEKYVDDGLSQAEAEAAANAEEEAARAAEEAAAVAEDDEEDSGPHRTQAFVCLKGFPLTPFDIIALHKQNLQVHAILALNSLARFGIRKEDLEKAKAAAAAAAASKGGKGGAPVDPKKPDPKKAPAGGAGGKKGEEVVIAPPADPLAIALKKELARVLAVSPFDVDHPLQHVVLWEYDVPSRLAGSNNAMNNAALNATVATENGVLSYDLVEPESATVLRVCERVVLLEQRYFDFQQWTAGSSLKQVPALSGAACGQDEAAAAAAAALKQRLAEEASRAAAAPAPGKKPAAKAAVKGEPAPVAAAAPSESPADSHLPPPRPAMASLPLTVAAIKAPALSAYQKQLSSSHHHHFLDSFVRATSHAVLEQLSLAESQRNEASGKQQHSLNVEASTLHSENGGGAAGGGNLSPTVTPRQRQRDENETLVAQLRQEVGAFVDFLFDRPDATTNTTATFSTSSSRNSEPTFESVHEKGAPLLVSAAGTTGVVHAPPHPGENQVASKHHNNHPSRPPPPAPQAPASSLLDCIKTALQKANITTTNVEELLKSRPLVDLLDAETFPAQVLKAAYLARGLGTTVVTENAADSGIDAIVLAAPSVTNRHRSRAFWASFHGASTYPQFNQWIDQIDSEMAYFYPPPRDEDDDEPEPEVAGDAEDLEEEDEEEEEYEDEDGVMQTRMKKKEKKIILYDPVFVDRAEERRAALRRRWYLEHLKRQVSTYQQGRQALLAHNQGAHIVYEEQELLFPEDGCVIETNISYGNSRSTQSTVHTVPSLCLGEQASFGFRAGLPEGKGKSGVHSTVLLRDARMTIVRSIPVAAPAAPVVEEASPSPTVVASPSSGKTPRPTGSASVHQPPAAVPAVNVEAVARGNTPRTDGMPSAAASHAAAVAEDTPMSTQVYVNCGAAHANITAVLNDQNKTLQLLPSDPLNLCRSAVNADLEHCVVLCFNSTTQSVQRRTVQSELNRQILRSGVVKVTLQTVPVLKEGDAPSTTPAVTSAPAVTPGGGGAPPSGKRDVGKAPTPSGVAPATNTPAPPLVLLPQAHPEEVHVMLFPDGTMTTMWRGALLLTNAHGHRTVRASPSQSPHNLSPLDCVETYDEATCCTIRQRRDDPFVTRFLFDDGREVIKFLDGTIFERQEGLAITQLRNPLPYPRCECTWDSPDHLGDGREGRSCQQIALLLEHDGLTHARLVWDVPSESVRFESLLHPLRAHAGLQYTNSMLHVSTTELGDCRYVIDTLFGGLRVDGKTWCCHVTPFGRCRARTTEEEYAPHPTDLTVRRTLEQFVKPTEPELFDANVLSRVTRAVEDAPSMGHVVVLHTSTQVPPAPLKWGPIQGFSDSNLPYAQTAVDHLHQREVEQRVLAIASSASGISPSSSSSAEVRLFLKLEDGRGVELMDPSVQRPSLVALLRASDTSSTDVVPRGTSHGCALVSLVASRLKPSEPPIAEPRYLQNGVASRPLITEQVTFETFKDRRRCAPPSTSSKPQTTEASVAAWQVRHFGSLAQPIAFCEATDAASRIASWFSAVQDNAKAVAEVEKHTTLLHRQRNNEQQQQTKLNKTNNNNNKNGGRAPLPSELTSNRGKIVNALDALKQNVEALRPATLNYWTHGASAEAKEEAARDRSRYANNALRNAGHDTPAAAPSRPCPAPVATRETTTTQQSSSPPATSPEKPKQASSNFFSSATRHVNPSSSAAVGQGMAYSFSKKFTQQRIVATPTEVDFGTVMEGFRYSTTIQLTNIATQNSRYRVAVVRTPTNNNNNSGSHQGQETDATGQQQQQTAPASVPWLSIGYPKLPIAAGMSVTVEVEIDGTQPVGIDVDDIALHVAYENGGMALVPVRLFTRSATERPVSQQKNSVRMIGPSRMKYVPGSVVMATQGN